MLGGKPERLAPLLLAQASFGPSFWLPAGSCLSQTGEAFHRCRALACEALPPVLTPKRVVSEFIEGLGLAASRACECAAGFEGLAVGAYRSFRHRHAIPRGYTPVG